MTSTVSVKFYNIKTKNAVSLLNCSQKNKLKECIYIQHIYIYIILNPNKVNLCSKRDGVRSALVDG